MKKLQILVPQYKETDEIIKPLLDSIEVQQNVDLINDIGVIIVNDGTDVHLSQDFLKRYSFPIEYYFNEHKGVSATRNACLDHATADYVMFCDNVARMYAAQAERDEGYRDYLLRVMYVAVTRAKIGICVWHRNEYRTVAPTYMFNNVGTFEGTSPSVIPLAEEYINKNIKEGTNADNNNHV